MKLFKRKKSTDTQLVAVPEPPEIIRPAVIKPTKCKTCRTVYQARAEHLCPTMDYNYVGKYMTNTLCPVCKNLNPAEFEEPEEVMP